MQRVQTKRELQKTLVKLRAQGSLGLVPTMGALHKGHASLIERSARENAHTVVSIFVNPTQFNNQADLQHYPRTAEADLDLIRAIAPNALVFSPSVAEMYTQDPSPKTYDFHGLDKVMEGAFRDDHFNGVGTVVEMLLRLVAPQKAYFGEKDFQQLRIVQKLTKTLNLPVDIVGCPIVREANGLAMSSRNERLSPEARQRAGIIHQTLTTAKEKFGTESVLEVKEWAKGVFDALPRFTLEYLEIADVDTLTPANKKQKGTAYRAFMAVYLEDVRLIDNMAMN
ncbi:pantoate--beta-alanine ligase [Maribacter sp. 2307ULW6-5]|uniref:pantoate--beta-alanine ligase n=1 Tax=Maribacter sp. 2307ULW6-5 TaxID=3386275 RepID=UPI0039BC44F6